MRRSIVTLLLAICLGAAATAAQAAQPFDWTGPYVGGLIGGGWGTGGGGSSANTSTIFLGGGAEFGPGEVATFNANGPQNLSGSGFLGGLEAGYNWQPNLLLLGIEGDIDLFDMNGFATTGSLPYAAGNFTITSRVNANWLATLRGRIGVAPGDWLFYVTGGAAF